MIATETQAHQTTEPHHYPAMTADILAALLDACGEPQPISISPREGIICGPAVFIPPATLKLLVDEGVLLYPKIEPDAIAPEFRSVAEVLLHPKTHLSFKAWSVSADPSLPPALTQGDYSFPGPIAEGDGVAFNHQGELYTLASGIEGNAITDLVALHTPPASSPLATPPQPFHAALGGSQGLVLGFLLDEMGRNPGEALMWTPYMVHQLIESRWAQPELNDLCFLTRVIGRFENPPTRERVNAVLEEFTDVGWLTRSGDQWMPSASLKSLSQALTGLNTGFRWERATLTTEGAISLSLMAVLYSDRAILHLERCADRQVRFQLVSRQELIHRMTQELTVVHSPAQGRTHTPLRTEWQAAAPSMADMPQDMLDSMFGDGFGTAPKSETPQPQPQPAASPSAPQETSAAVVNPPLTHTKPAEHGEKHGQKQGENAQKPAENPQKSPQKPPKKFKKRWLLLGCFTAIAVIVLIVVAIVAITVYSIVNSGKFSQSSTGLPVADGGPVTQNEAPAAGGNEGLGGFLDELTTDVIMGKTTGKPAAKLFPTRQGSYVDKTGKEVIPPGRFSVVSDFHEGYSLTCTGEYTQLLCGYINEKGEEIINLTGTYDSESLLFDNETAMMGEGLIAEQVGPRHWRFIDKTADFSLDVKDVTMVRHFSEGLAPFQMESGYWGYMDKQGNTVIPASRFTNAFHFSSGIARVYEVDNSSHERVIYINQRGENVFRDRWFIQGSDVVNGTIAVLAPNQNGKWGILNTRGEWVIKPSRYVWMAPFSEGLAAVMEGSESAGYRVGFMNRSGQMVIQPQFVDTPRWLDPNVYIPRYMGRHLYVFRNGIAGVNVLPNECCDTGYINKQGQRLY